MCGGFPPPKKTYGLLTGLCPQPQSVTTLPWVTRETVAPKTITNSRKERTRDFIIFVVGEGRV